MSHPNPAPARLVIKEPRQASLRARAFVSLVALVLVAGLVASSALAGAGVLADLMSSAMVAFAVILLGVAALVAWRKSGEYEFVERVEDRIFVRTTRASHPVFDAPISEVRFQKLVLPGGSAQLFLRDGIRAVELGSEMTQADKEAFREQMERLLGIPALVR